MIDEMKTNSKKVKDAVIEEVKTTSEEFKDVAEKASAPWFEGLRKLPLASLGLAATLGDDTKAFFVDQLVMNKLVARGEALQKDVEQWMKDVQARFH